MCSVGTFGRAFIMKLRYISTHYQVTQHHMNVVTVVNCYRVERLLVIPINLYYSKPHEMHSIKSFILLGLDEPNTFCLLQQITYKEHSCKMIVDHF